MIYLSSVIGQTILVVLTIATLIFILKTPPEKRAQRFQQSLPHLRKLSLGVGIAFFVVAMLSFLPFSPVMIFTLGVIFLWFVNLWLPFKSYASLFERENSGLITFIFIANMLLNAGGISFMLKDTYPYITLQDFSEFYISLFAITLVLWMANIMCHLFVQLVFRLRDPFRGRKAPRRRHKSYSSDKIKAYQEAGLTNEDITYFREQMAPVQANIFQLEETMNETAKLRSINQRHNTIVTCQEYFRSIVQEPKRIGEAGTFIYKLLPNLTDLVDKYNEINGHVAKNKQTYLILDRSAQMIERIAEEINDDYIQFHHATYQALDDEIAYAEKILNDDNDTSEMRHDAQATSLENLIDDMNDFLK
ncbi:5-bromo-4-chloroindolyl phosphate hydrolysis family protein [Aerococcaceae bacterium DSM 111020]|nr:5-bromo-4-chloroindolyl phosphate hydrolysis family protein [Aerococcaceae bacterium DSM 111020]